MAMKQTRLAVIFSSIITMFALVGCVNYKAQEADVNDSLSLCALPESKDPKDECTCLKEAISALNLFAERMNDSKYAAHYQVMSRQKIQVIQNRADKIGCKFLTPDYSSLPFPDAT
jgi:hypothetical protein